MRREAVTEVDTGPIATILEIGWLVTAVLIPLWVNLWADQPFELSKVLLLRTLSWMLAALWSAEWLLKRDRPWPTLRRNPLLAPIGSLTVVLGLATYLGIHPSTSLWGSYLRGQGLLTQVSYVLLFLVVATRLRSPEQARRLATAMVFTAAPIVLLGLLQSARLDPLGMISDARSPIYATLGRANFVGAYLALLLPLTVALALTASQPWQRGLLFLLMVGQQAVIAWTLARAAWLAAGTGLVVFALLWYWPKLTRRKRVWVLVGGAGATLTSLAGGVYGLLRATGGSLAARRTIWTAIWQLIRERPLLGYGPDALELVFPRVYPPQLVYYQGRDVFVDRAHNLLLDWAMTAGLVGAAAFALVLGIFVVVGLRRAARLHAQPDRRILLIACLAAAAGNLAGNLVSFDVTATSLATWLLMALVVSPAMASGDADVAPPEAAVDRPAVPWPRLLAAGMLVLGAAVAIVHCNVRPLMANVAHRTATRHATRGELDKAVAFAEKAVGHWPVEPAHHWLVGQYAAQFALQLVERTGSGGDWLARAETAFLTARDLRPLDPMAWAALGEFYGVVGERVQPAVFPLAHTAYGQALALAPHRARLYVAWGQVFLAEDRLEAALERFYRAVDLDATDGLAFRLIGDVELALGRPEAGLRAYQEAARWSPDAVLVHLGLARSYAALGQPAEARVALERAMALDPQHPLLRAMQQNLIDSLPKP